MYETLLKIKFNAKIVLLLMFIVLGASFFQTSLARSKTVITKVLCSDYYSEDDTLQSPQNLLRIDIQLTNTSSTPIEVQERNFYVMDSSGNKYVQSDTFPSTHPDHESLIAETLNPSVPRKFTLFFRTAKHQAYRLGMVGNLQSTTGTKQIVLHPATNLKDKCLFRSD